MAGLLYARDIRVNDAISIHVPLVGEILDAEDQYFEIISTVIATPYDMMVQLDDAGIDFTKITAFELFCLVFSNIQSVDTSLVFGDLDLSVMQPALSPDTKELVLVDTERNIAIDRAVHEQICQIIRKLLYIPKVEKKPANDEAKRYMLQRARKRLERRKRQEQDNKSQIEDIIIALVNTEQFSYNYETVRDLTVYQFYSSLQQISHKIKFDNTMSGYYAGNVKFEDLKPEDRTWLRS